MQIHDLKLYLSRRKWCSVVMLTAFSLVICSVHVFKRYFISFNHYVSISLDLYWISVQLYTVFWTRVPKLHNRVIFLNLWVYLICLEMSFDGRMMVWRCLSVRPYVRSVVHNPCGQDIARTMWPRMLKLSV